VLIRLKHLALVTIAVTVVACRSDDRLSGAPDALTVVAGAQQEASVGTAVATAPAVRVIDGSGDAVGGAVVRFTVLTGGGTVLGDSTVTDAQGRAAVTQWILGTVPGSNTLGVSLDNTQLTAVVSAQALTGPPASVRSSGQAGFVGLVDQAVSPNPAIEVVDSYGNPVAGVPVTFTVTSGGGRVTMPTVTTNGGGLAQVGSWQLGPNAGDNQLTASIVAGGQFVFAATAVNSAPIMTAASPTSQSGYLSFPVTQVPRVKLTDPAGAPLVGIPVTFTLGAGDATVAGGVVSTDTAGIAAPADWRLGLETESTLTATTALGAAPVSFTATGVAPQFLIDLRFLTTMTPDVRDAFVAAARRWMGIITAHVPAVSVDLPAGACAPSQPAVNETVGDLVIFAEVTPIDGVGNVLGDASPCVTREESGLPVVGNMEFDSADLQALVGTGQLPAVITHEMAHVLGFGTLWSSLNLTQGLGTDNPLFIGSQALALWPAFEPQLVFPGPPIPLENSGGAGTRDAHWRESVFHAELMTGYIEAPGVPMPLSKLTIATMADMGYQVDYSKADPFAGNLLAAGSVAKAPTVLGERITGPTWQITPFGTERIH
jgi:hypothetical protein